jgi:hypothetical protein
MLRGQACNAGIADRFRQHEPGNGQAGDEITRSYRRPPLRAVPICSGGAAALQVTFTAGHPVIAAEVRQRAVHQLPEARRRHHHDHRAGREAVHSDRLEPPDRSRTAARSDRACPM